jgi:hypothetical protein
MNKRGSFREIVFAVLTLIVLTIMFGCSISYVGNDVPTVPEIVIRNVQAGDVNIDVSVDPRTELMSIIFRLAGNKEYNACRIRKYDRNIEKYFKPYKGHSAVKFAASLRKKRGMGYNAPMALAVHVDKVPNLEELVLLDPRPAELDGRWRPEEAREFLEEARLFAKESNFGKFYNYHKTMYEKAVSDLTQLLENQAHFEWFENFFGQKTKPHLNVLLGMANGSNSYAASVVIKGKKHIYSVLGVWRCDLFGFGNPKFHRQSVGTIHHELCHSYSNPIVFKYSYSDELRAAGQRIFPKLQDKMRSQAYPNWQTMMCEYVVRVCTIQYYKRYGTPDTVEREIKKNIIRGFVGMRELNEAVSKYEDEREKYPTFESFFPRVIEFFDEYSKKFASDEE